VWKESKTHIAISSSLFELLSAYDQNDENEEGGRRKKGVYKGHLCGGGGEEEGGLPIITKSWLLGGIKSGIGRSRARFLFKRKKGETQSSFFKTSIVVQTFFFFST
jgi:hypothetical protein